MHVAKLFTNGDLEAVKRAVHEAEARTSGEIVPCVVGTSDDYPEALWRGATLGALAGALAAALVHDVGGFWGGWFAAWVIVPPVLGSGLGFALALLVPALRRVLVDPGTIERNVRRRAEVAFLEEEVFRTRDRTGILILVSLFERRVVVLGDAGINAAVTSGEWDSIVAGIVAGIRAGRPAQALVEGIAACGRLLERRGVAIKPDDTDELRDDLRTQDR
jgi:putative membrane protein